MRKATHWGPIQLLVGHPQIYAFTRTLNDDRLLVPLNFSAETPLLELPEDVHYGDCELPIANCLVDPSEEFR
ncbi:MAG: hypothetical protein R2844_02775 [Caldilineales bacterium]